MKKIFLLLFTTLSLYALVDLGTYGGTHTINEDNFIDKVMKKSKDLNATKLKNQFIKGENDYLKVNNLLPICVKTKKREFIPTFIVPTDVVTSDGKIIARRGDVLNTLEVMSKNNTSLDGYIMYIDVSDEIQVQLSYLYKNQGKVFVTNGDMNKYEKLTKIHSYKADKLNIEKFGVICTPSLIIQDGNKLLIYEYNPKDLEKKE